VQGDEVLAGICLYILQRLPTEAALPALAKFLTTRQLGFITADLGPTALLAATKTEVVGEPVLQVAIRDARAILKNG
jgi:hypothetical protein